LSEGHRFDHQSPGGSLDDAAASERLLSGEDFDPQAEETTFRVAVTDHASHVLCPLICRKVLPAAGKVSIEFAPFGDHAFEAIEKGRLDLMLNADDGHVPARSASDIIFENGRFLIDKEWRALLM
jgi:hypothetical protein